MEQSQPPNNGRITVVQATTTILKWEFPHQGGWKERPLQLSQPSLRWTYNGYMYLKAAIVVGLNRAGYCMKETVAGQARAHNLSKYEVEHLVVLI